MRIMLAGPSGIGKTTLANWISECYGIEFVSSSVSDLLTHTKDMTHQDMLSRDPKELYKEDFQILNLRNKVFKDRESFVSDRSYLDSIGYFLYKQADRIPSCEMEHFISTAGMLLVRQCDLLIVLELVPEDVHNWVTEDNKKRVTSNYFQILITSCIRTGLSLLDYDETGSSYTLNKGLFNTTLLNRPVKQGIIKNVYGSTDVVIIRDLNFANRTDIIKKIICRRK